MSDWLFDFVVFSLLTARPVSKQIWLPKPKSWHGMYRLTKCDIFLLAHSTYRGETWGETLKRACEVRALRARKTLTARFTDFFSDFQKKTDCFAV